MARPRPWIGRIPQILQELEDSHVDLYKRSAIEELFGIGKSAAKDLMRVAGATQARPDDPQTLAVSRVNLLHYVRHSPEAQEALIELRRRQKLAETLKEADEETRLRRVKLPVTSADEWCSLKELPNVSIEPGMLRVAFNDPLELMGDLYRLAKAAGGDWDSFVRACVGEPKMQTAMDSPSPAGEPEEHAVRGARG